MTAIVDNDQAVCFIMPLNRTLVKPPKSFWDMMVKLKVRSRSGRKVGFFPQPVIVLEPVNNAWSVVTGWLQTVYWDMWVGKRRPVTLQTCTISRNALIFSSLLVVSRVFYNVFSGRLNPTHFTSLRVFFNHSGVVGASDQVVILYGGGSQVTLCSVTDA